MRMNPYRSFSGECEEAFTFYEHCLGGRTGTIFRYAGTPLADRVPPDWHDKVMHGSLTVGGRGRASVWRPGQGRYRHRPAGEDVLGRTTGNDATSCG